MIFIFHVIGKANTSAGFVLRGKMYMHATLQPQKCTVCEFIIHRNTACIAKDVVLTQSMPL